MSKYRFYTGEMHIECGSEHLFTLCVRPCCSWQPESKFPFSQVFLPPKDTGKHTEFVENQEVEVFARSNEKEACGWWTANIKVLDYNNIGLYSFHYTHLCNFTKNIRLPTLPFSLPYIHIYIYVVLWIFSEALG